MFVFILLEANVFIWLSFFTFLSFENLKTVAFAHLFTVSTNLLINWLYQLNMLNGVRLHFRDPPENEEMSPIQ